MRDSLGGINEYKNLLTSFKDDSTETLDYAHYQKRKIIDLQQASNWEDFRQFILDDTQQVFNPHPKSSPHMTASATILKLTPTGTTKNMNSKNENYRNGYTEKNEDNGNTKKNEDLTKYNGNAKRMENVAKSVDTRKNGEDITKNGNIKKITNAAKSVDTRKNVETQKNDKTNNGNTGTLQVNTRYGHTLNVNVTTNTNVNVLNEAKLKKGNPKKRLLILKPTKSVPSTPRILIKKKVQMEIEDDEKPIEGPVKTKDIGRGKWKRKPKNPEIEATTKNKIEKKSEFIIWPSRFQVKIENEEKKEEEEQETLDLPSKLTVKHEPEVKKEFEEDILTPEPVIPEVKKNLKRKRSSPNIKNKPNLEKNSVLGKLDKDTPERIITHAIYDIANKTPPDRRLFLVAWKKRKSGEQPENSYCTGKDLKEKCPAILLSYYEEKATFV